MPIYFRNFNLFFKISLQTAVNLKTYFVTFLRLRLFDYVNYIYMMPGTILNRGTREISELFMSLAYLCTFLRALQRMRVNRVLGKWPILKFQFIPE